VIGEIESWANHPVDIQVVSPFATWYLDDWGDKVEVEAKWVKSECSDYDHSIHISSPKNPTVDGFYQYRTARLNDHATFSNGDIFLYYISSHNRYTRWMMSHDYGSDSGIAYIDNAKDLPHNTEGSWQVTTSNGWQHDHSLKMTRSMFTRSSWRSLMFRRQKEIAEIGAESYTLRNEMQLPKVLIDGREATSAYNLRVAHQNRYRLFLLSKKQMDWIPEVDRRGRVVSALRIPESDPTSILSSIDSVRKYRGFLDCAVLDVSSISASDIPAAWSVLEKAYADGKMLCVGSVGGNMEKNKILASRPLAPHFMMLSDLGADLKEFLEVVEDKNILLYFDNGLQGDFISSEKRSELSQIAKSKRASIPIVHSAWSLSHNHGASHVLKPSSSLQDARMIFNFKFDSPVGFKDEL